ncbi:MAG: murein biosynthesis integral membrane protein MurJ [bacterium]
MLSKFLNNQSKTLTGAAIMISGAAFLSRIVGLLRDRIFAHHYGAGMVMDSYAAAFKIPDLIYGLLVIGALSAGFIPTFTKLITISSNKEPAWKLANNVLNILAICLIALCALGFIFAPQLTGFIAPGFNNETFILAVRFSRIMLCSTLLLGISMVMGGILQSFRSFVIYSIAPIFYNVGIIFGVVALVPLIGISGIAWGVVLGALLHCCLQIYGAYKMNYRWKWNFNLKDKNTRLIAKLMIPRTLGMAITQINMVVMTIFASLLPLGSLAIFSYAKNLQDVPAGIIGIPFALAAFPILSSAVAGENEKKFISTLSQTIRQILFLIAPISVLMLLLRAQIVRVILGSGAFDWTSTINTADTLAFFCLSLFAQSLIPLFARAFYSLQDTKTPFVIALVSELITIIAALIFMKKLGTPGLALAISIGALINMTLLAYYLRDTTKFLDGHRIFNSMWKIATASLAMAIVIQWAKYPLARIVDQEKLWGIFSQGFIAGIAGLAIYCLMCYFLNLPEFKQFTGSFRKKWLKIRGIKISENIDLKN